MHYLFDPGGIPDNIVVENLKCYQNVNYSRADEDQIQRKA